VHPTNKKKKRGIISVESFEINNPEKTRSLDKKQHKKYKKHFEELFN
jgi:hypothetical protein